MFGFLALGFFAAFAFGANGGLLGLLGIKSISELFNKKDKDDEDDKKAKEKEDKDKKELHDLLKKKPEDLSPKEKKRLEELSKTIDLEDELSPKEMEAFKKATGKSVEEVVEENKKLEANKCLAVAQSKLDELDDDNSEEAKQARKNYDELVKCAFDEDGNMLSPEEFEKNFNSLPKDIKDNIEKEMKATANDPKALEEFNKKMESITPEQAAAAVENAKANRLEVAKREAIEKLEKEKAKELEGATPEKRAEIEEQYNAKIKNTGEKYDLDIDKFRKAAAAADKSEAEKQAFRIAKKEKAELETQKSAIEKEDPKEMVQKYIDAKDLPGFNPGKLDEKDKDGKYTEEAQKQRKTLEDAGLNPDIYAAIDKKRSDKEDISVDDIAKDADIESKINDDKQKRIEAVDKKIEEQQKKISEYREKQKGVQQTNNQNTSTQTGGTGEAKTGGTGEPEKVIKTVKGFERKKGDKDWVPEIDEDGDPTGNFAVCCVKEKGEDGKEKLKYVMRDSDGEEAEISKEDFDNHKKKFNEFKDELNPEDEEKLDDALDKNYQETDDEKNSEDGKQAERDKKSGKRVNPAKIWHKKKNKATGKVTKSYYNKEGKSISAKDYQKKVQSYQAYVQKHKKTDESIVSYLRDKLIVERFYPNDITQYLKENL